MDVRNIQNMILLWGFPGNPLEFCSFICEKDDGTSINTFFTLSLKMSWKMFKYQSHLWKSLIGTWYDRTEVICCIWRLIWESGRREILCSYTSDTVQSEGALKACSLFSKKLVGEHCFELETALSRHKEPVGITSERKKSSAYKAVFSLVEREKQKFWKKVSEKCFLLICLFMVCLYMFAACYSSCSC